MAPIRLARFAHALIGADLGSASLAARRQHTRVGATVAAQGTRSDMRDRDGPTEVPHPFLHADQSNPFPSAPCRSNPWPSSRMSTCRASSLAEIDHGALRPGMPGDVSQRLLEQTGAIPCLWLGR